MRNYITTVLLSFVCMFVALALHGQSAAYVVGTTACFDGVRVEMASRVQTRYINQSMVVAHTDGHTSLWYKDSFKHWQSYQLPHGATLKPSMNSEWPLLQGSCFAVDYSDGSEGLVVFVDGAWKSIQGYALELFAFGKSGGFVACYDQGLRSFTRFIWSPYLHTLQEPFAYLSPSDDYEVSFCQAGDGFVQLSNWKRVLVYDKWGLKTLPSNYSCIRTTKNTLFCQEAEKLYAESCEDGSKSWWPRPYIKSEFMVRCRRYAYGLYYIKDNSFTALISDLRVSAQNDLGEFIGVDDKRMVYYVDPTGAQYVNKLPSNVSGEVISLIYKDDGSCIVRTTEGKWQLYPKESYAITLANTR
jgi:hypothetical protein